MLENANYAAPVNQLLAYGEPEIATAKNWPDYPKLFGLGPENIPDLIRLATDQELHKADLESTEVWGPLHAWRALGQLRAETAIDSLLTLRDALEDDEWVLDELPEVFAMIGPAAIGSLQIYLADPSHNMYSRSIAGSGLAEIAKRWPDRRDECVNLLAHQLESVEGSDPSLNGFIIADLVELKAVETAPVIEKAFAEDRVDESIEGDWEDVQIELGLKQRPKQAERIDANALYSTSIPFNTNTSLDRSVSFNASVGSHNQNLAQRAKVKNKRKIEKASRRKNRKHK